MIFLALPNSGCKDTKTSCSKFKEGKYLLHSKDDGSNYTIDRNDSFQIETSEATGLKTKWKINWLSDCEYQTVFEEEDFGKATTDPATIKFKYLTFRIIKAREEYYIFSTKINRIEISDTLWKIKEP